MTERLLEGRLAMRFTVTGSTTCPTCRDSRSFCSELDAKSHVEAMRKFQDTHCYCFRCSLFGIRARLDFDSYMQIEKKNNSER